ncbi:hypothetical protein KG007_09995 [Alistipes sp. kh20]|uniref:hypothetical protein n=1 Tax=Alistipes montrealensis TaxID=2834113 RepID=UPI001BCCDF6C|nr:hypothetical protein [Alistipes montrealensis]MBS4766534.1 hypothetical protein [Alistipes montrealensis]
MTDFGLMSGLFSILYPITIWKSGGNSFKNGLNMKSCVFGKWSALLCLMVFVGGGIFSCSDKNDDTPGFPKEKVIGFIRENLYNADGNVAANKMSEYQEGEFNLIADDEYEVREYFAKMTGIEIPEAETYKAVYRSSDGKCVIEIEGTRLPRAEIFADVRFSVPEFPEIKLIHIGTKDMMEAGPVAE